jgi:hypothetical protein
MIVERDNLKETGMMRKGEKEVTKEMRERSVVNVIKVVGQI